MIIKQELIKNIRNHFNLNVYEAKVWLALLSRGISTAGEIAEVSGVPRSRTYDVLEGLEKRGFAIEKLGKPVKYIAVKPALVVEKLKNQVTKEAGERSKILNSLKSTTEYSELELLHKQGIEPVKAAELSGAIKGKANVYSQLHGLIEDSKKNITLVTTPAALEDEIKLLKQLKTKIQRNNIPIKIAVNADGARIKELSKELGLPVKAMNINARFCISDGEQVLFMLNEAADEDIAVWINSEFFSSALQNLFDSAWQGK